MEYKRSGLKSRGLLLLAIMVSLNLPAQQLLNKDCRIVMKGSVYFVVQDMKLINDGEIIVGNSSVIFTGDESTSIGGTSLTHFNNVFIKKAFGKAVELHQNISVAGILAMRNGNLLLNNQRLDLGTTGSIVGESSQSYITGTGGSVLANRILATPPTAFNAGNIGVAITSPVALGKIFIERKHRPETLPGGVQSIQRSFTISTAVKYGLNAELRFYYLDEELAGAYETELNIWTGSDISNSWILAGKDASDMSNNWVSKKGLDRMGRFTLASTGIIFKEKSVTKSSMKNTLTSKPFVNVYPNPSRNKCLLEFFSPEKKQSTIKLYDQWGRVLEQKSITYLNGMNRIVWDLEKFAAGTYVIADNAGYINEKIVKQ